VTWSAANGSPAGYFVARQIDGGSFERLHSEPWIGTSYADVAPPAGDLCYRVEATRDGAVGPASDVACIAEAAAKSHAIATGLPRAPALHAAPNPFNPNTVIRLDLPHAGGVQLDVFDVRGRRVATLWHGSLPAGTHAFPWQARDQAGRACASGIYLVRMRAAGTTRTLRLVLVQ
jgi:hypothetical protein